MLVLLSYFAVAVAFYLACMVEIHRTRSRSPLPYDSADRIILHLVAVVAALLWLATVPVLLRIGVRRLRPRRTLAEGEARISSRLPQRRPRLAG